MSKIWYNENGNFFRRSESEKHETLPVGIYEVVNIPFEGTACRLIANEFSFNHKIYGFEEEFINRVKKTYEKTDKNLGILLNGIKCTGKTVTAKMICNLLKLPVMIINDKEDKESKIDKFINSIKQDVVIFVDEYEKIYEMNANLLTIMDGVQNSAYKRVFILTTNSLRINDNMIDRPSRIRYIKTYDNLSQTIVKEMLEDILENKSLLEATFEFISNLELITVDIVKSIIEEINIYNESPIAFKNFFNCKKISDKFDVYEIKENTTDPVLLLKSTKISPRYFVSENIVGESFYVNGDYIGEIVELVDRNIIKVEIKTEMKDPENPKKRIEHTEYKTYTFTMSNVINPTFKYSV